MSSRLVFSAAVAAFTLLGSVATANAAGVLDQSALVQTGLGPFSLAQVRGGTNFPTSRAQVQTVTAGLNGLLSQVDLQVVRGLTGGDFTLSIYNGDYAQAFGVNGPNGAPGGNGTFIGSFTTAIANIPDAAAAAAGTLYSVDTSSLGFQVVAGQVFSLLFSSSSFNGTVDLVNGYLPDPQDPNNIVGLDYAGGYNSANFYDATFSQSAFDRGFQTYVDSSTGGVPEPATWALMIGGFGLAGVGLRRRRTATLAA